jgi:murein DD-endopeptidase MepM/ murein hydrolase activator NlpD
MRPWLVCAGLLLALGVPTTATAASANVAALQVALRAHADYAGDVDGIAGPGTDAGTARFQAAHGLTADGIAGPRTRRALGWRGRHRLRSRALHAGDRGWDAAALQFLLAIHGFPSGAMDGILGPHADAAIRRFQAWAGLTADGIAGPATLARLHSPPPRSPLIFDRPINAPIGSGFGPRGGFMHPGLDYTAPTGAPVAAAGRGCVIKAGWDSGGYGLLVIIQHRLGMTSWYAHLSRIAVRPGQCVVAGTRIGAVGATGFATGPHLHFELRLNGAAVDPLPVTR